MTALAVGSAALVPAASALAADASPEVNIEFSAYGPSQLDILPGETVTWTNVSRRTHTVTSDTRLFNSGDVQAGGRFTFTFTAQGTYAYHCTIHPSIVGEVDVRPVILGSLPTAVVAVGARIEFIGRTADPTRLVAVQLRPDGLRFRTVATARPAADGSWKTIVAATETGDFRAVSGGERSETRRLLVSDRRVLARATRSGVGITVTPAAPYARYLVEVYRRERFGWWPVEGGRVDYLSEAEVGVPGPARVRIVLVDRDGWTPLATSRTLLIAGPGRPRR